MSTLWNGSYYQSGQVDPRPEVNLRQNGRLFLIENTSVNLSSLLQYQSVRRGSGANHYGPVFANVSLTFKGTNPGLWVSVSHAGNPTPDASPNISVHTTYTLNGIPSNFGSINYYRALVDVGIPVAEWTKSPSQTNTELPANREVGFAPKVPVFFTNSARTFYPTGSGTVGWMGPSVQEYGWSNVGWAYSFWHSPRHPVNAWFWVCVVSQPPKVTEGQSLTLFKNFPVRTFVAMDSPLQRIPESISVQGLPNGLNLTLNSRPDEVMIGGQSFPASTEPELSGAVSNSVSAGTYTANVTATNPVGSTTTPITIVVVDPPPQYFAVGASISSAFKLGDAAVSSVYLGDTQVYPYT